MHDPAGLYDEVRTRGTLVKSTDHSLTRFEKANDFYMHRRIGIAMIMWLPRLLYCAGRTAPRPMGGENDLVPFHACPIATSRPNDRVHAGGRRSAETVRGTIIKRLLHRKPTAYVCGPLSVGRPLVHIATARRTLDGRRSSLSSFLYSPLRRARYSLSPGPSSPLPFDVIPSAYDGII